MRKQPIEETRNGLAKVCPRPVLIEFRHPWERVLFDEMRDANPMFHLMESLWMLAGKRDVEFIQLFNSNMRNYSDDGEVFNGAYGYRWREYFGYDQIATAVEVLKKSPHSRQAVIAMWDGYEDLGSKSLDLPCNLMIAFRINQGKLIMTTYNRSNDVVWGLLGANAVHLTMLQEYMAVSLGCQMGEWYHFSNNLHVYEKHWPLLEDDLLTNDRADWEWLPYPKRVPIDKPDEFYMDCLELCEGKVDYFETEFFDTVVAPAVQSWQAWKGGDKEQALSLADCIQAEDWGIAIHGWYQRRINRDTIQADSRSA